jgi:predicted short-subunit dehydrogenase-like oxidoreductase (DUF2520 family)
MQVTIIGTGNVASVLGKLIQQSGHTIVEIIGRNKEQRELLARACNAVPQNIERINQNSDVYIITVSDTAIPLIASKLILENNPLVVHTAGSVSKKVLQQISGQYGVLWPLQSIRKETTHFPEIPFVIDASNDEAKIKLEIFARTLSNVASFANDEQRIKLHLAAVIASNFTNYLYSLTEEYCKKEKLDFRLLFPLINETTERLKNYSPAETQTGPAIRGDVSTINEHLHLLAKQPQLQHIYKVLSENIMQSGSDIFHKS